MKNIYQIGFTGSMLLLSIIVSSCGQNPKIKTITIVNGDTTISEGEFNEKEFAEMGKHIEISMTGDGDGSEKRIKKILISNENEENKANSESTNNNDQEEREVQVTKNENGTETRIIVKKREEKNQEETRKIVKKEIGTVSEAKGNNTLNLNISIKNTTATIIVKTNSKEALNINVLNENGKQIFYDTQKTGGKYNKEIPLGKKGTYFLNLIQNKKSTTEKIIIE
jgi:hypothetical protein